MICAKFAESAARGQRIGGICVCFAAHATPNRHTIAPSQHTSGKGYPPMRVIVLGSGVVGVTSAWYLAKAGHEVTVLERQSAPGMETSFANAGQLSYGYSAPWAGPGIPVKAL